MIVSLFEAAAALPRKIFTGFPSPFSISKISFIEEHPSYVPNSKAELRRTLIFLLMFFVVFFLLIF